jgi:DNA-binding transcriptional MerR regulator
MTIGALSRRTGVPVKMLREYEDLGFIYTAGRSPGGYRLFDDEALWCVPVVTTMRALGLTLAEMRGLTQVYLDKPGPGFGPRLAAVLTEVRARTERQLAELRERLERLDAFESTYADELAGRADFQTADPRLGDAPG